MLRILTILQLIEKQLIDAISNAKAKGIETIDIYTNSFGGKYIYDILRDDAIRGSSQFHIRNLVNINSQLRYFGASDLSNVDTWINIYNPNDIGNLIANPFQDSVLTIVKSFNPVLLSIPNIRIINSPTGSISQFVPRVEEYQRDISHEIFWNDPQVREIMERYLGRAD
jgi:hypothetical protein